MMVAAVERTGSPDKKRRNKFDFTLWNDQFVFRPTTATVAHTEVRTNYASKRKNKTTDAFQIDEKP